MKKRLYLALIILTMLLLLIPTNMVFAEIIESGTCGENVTWTLDSAGTLTISGSGAMDDTPSSSDSKWAWKCKTLVIEEGVTYVGAYSFNDCRYLTNVTIKSGLQKIGSSAFSGCGKLTEVNLNDNIAFIESSAFSNCSALVSINIPNQLKKISPWTFGRCESLKEIKIPDGLIEVGYSAFSGCKNLEKIVLPESITTIGERIFEGCSALTSVKLPNSIKIISDNMFSGCSSLQDIVIPENVEEIGYFAFNDCTALDSIKIPSSVQTIACWAFDDCTNLKEVHISDISAWCNITFIRGGTSPFTVNPLCYANNLYLNNELVTKLIIPDNITKIPDYAFVNCSSITSVTVPKSITDVGISAFANCENLKTINYYGDSNGWSEINISSGNTQLETANKVYNYVASGICGDNATWTLDSEGTLTVSGSGKIYVYTILGSFPNKVDTPWDDYYDCIKKIVINDGIEGIGDYAFSNCSEIVSVSIPDSVTSIGTYAFLNCSSLENVTLSKYITSLSLNPFAGCTSLKKFKVNSQNEKYKAVNGILYNKTGTELVAFPNMTEYKESIFDGVTKIGRAAFRGNTSIESINIPGNITTIGDFAFYYARGLETITLNEGLTEVETLHCFQGCESLKKINIPASLKNIPSFAGCTSLKEITYSGEPTSMGSLSRCTSLEEINVPDSVTGMWNGAFAYCTNLKFVELSAKQTKIAPFAFNECTSLENIILPESITNVEPFAFWQCTNLKSIVIPKSVNIIDDSAFRECDSLDTVYYTGTPEEWNNISISDFNNDAILYADIVYNYVPSSIILDKHEMSMYAGESKNLAATIFPENSEISWSSSNDNVVSISSTGVVTAKTVGTAKITASINNGAAADICTISVVPVTPSGITIDKTELSLNIGSTSKVNATVLPENAENKNVSWTSSNTDVVDVDSNGNITAKSIGSAEIKAETEIGGYTAICKVSVLPINVNGITLSSSEVSLAEKATTTISATITPENATDKTVIWSSSNENVATVTNGVITGVSEGTTVIIAKTNDGNYTAYCAVTVTAAKVSVKSISLNQSSVTIVEGYTDTLSASIKPENATNQNVLWSSNNKNVATVDNGVITAVAPGTAVVIATAEDGGQIATCIVNVVSAMQDQVSKPIASVLSGAVQTGENILLLTATRGAEIHYTTDGSAPTKESNLYTEPIQITEALKLKAVAVKSGMVDSDVASFSYTIADPNVPYVSVQTNLTGNKGETTTVSVNISENSGSAGGSFNLVYDTDSVELVSVENGTYISKANPIVNDSYANNKIRTVWAGSKALSGGGEILSATFRILDSTQNDTAYFNLEKLKLADDNATKLICLQSNGVLALMSVDTAVQDKEFLTQSVLAEDNKTLSVTVSANTEDTAKLYAAVYDDKQLIQIKSIDVMKNSEPYNIVFDTAVGNTQTIKVFIWDENMMPLSTGETVEK